MERMGFLILFLLMGASLAIATSGGGEHEAASEAVHHIPTWGEVIKPLILRAVNFIGFSALLYFFLRKPIAAFLLERRRVVEETISESAKKKKWAEDKFSEYNKRLENIEDEIQKLNTSLKKEGEIEGQKTVGDAKKLAESIRKDASMVAQAELEELRVELRNQAIEMAALVAKETLQKTLTQKDEERISQEFLQALEEKRL